MKKLFCRVRLLSSDRCNFRSAQSTYPCPAPAWEQRKLGELCDIVGGGTPSTAVADYWDGDIDWYSPAEIGEDVYADGSVRKITKTGYEKCSAQMLPAGRTVLFTSRAGIGDMAILCRSGCTNQGFQSLVVKEPNDPYFFYSAGGKIKDYALTNASGSTFLEISGKQLERMVIAVPSEGEQRQIGALFAELDRLITLHQREHESESDSQMKQEYSSSKLLFVDYYDQWVKVYKEGAIRNVTMGKYRLTQSWLRKLVPELELKDMDRMEYQNLINGYAAYHERQTTMDFHHQLKGAILDAVDEGLIERDPTRKAIIKGRTPRPKKTKYLNQFELHAVLADLELGDKPSWDWLIMIIAKTGLRFSEAVGLTPSDFDFVRQTVSVSKTWDYKNGGGFVPTKNASSVRKVQLDWQLVMQLAGMLKGLDPEKPIFVKGKVYNSTANHVLARHCRNVGVPEITIHGLRHTHASLLLFAGVSIASVSRRLGHASMTTTQETYLHVIQELENQDVDIVMRSLAALV